MHLIPESPALHYGAGVVGALLVLTLGSLLARRAAAAES